MINPAAEDKLLKSVFGVRCPLYGNPVPDKADSNMAPRLLLLESTSKPDLAGRLPTATWITRLEFGIGGRSGGNLAKCRIPPKPSRRV